MLYFRAQKSNLSAILTAYERCRREKEIFLKYFIRLILLNIYELWTKLNLSSFNNLMPDAF